MGQVGGVLVSIGLFWLAFTTYKGVHWIAPIIALVPLGTGNTFHFHVIIYVPRRCVRTDCSLQ